MKHLFTQLELSFKQANFGYRFHIFNDFINQSTLEKYVL